MSYCREREEALDDAATGADRIVAGRIRPRTSCRDEDPCGDNDENPEMHSSSGHSERVSSTLTVGCKRSAVGDCHDTIVWVDGGRSRT